MRVALCIVDVNPFVQPFRARYKCLLYCLEYIIVSIMQVHASAFGALIISST
jgi:hypothetical protein